MGDEPQRRGAVAASSARGRDRGKGPAARFRPSVWSSLQARRIKLWLALAARGVFRFRINVEGVEHIPRDEPVIVAAAPHRGWIDPFLILAAMPALPRLYFIAAADLPGASRWKRLAVEIAGGMVPVSTAGHLNREALELSLAILESGNRVGLFPEGWEDKPDPAVMPLRRGVAFLSEHSGRRVLPVGLAGNKELWRGATLRVRFAPPLAALAPRADRAAEQEFVDRLREVLIAATPPTPPAPANKRWAWLTHLI